MSLVLVDSSAWVDFFRAAHSPYATLVDTLLKQGTVCIIPLILAEVISGAPDEETYRKLHLYFHGIPVLDDAPHLWERITEARFRLSRQGISGMSIPDLMIAVFATHYRYPLVTKDRHFQLIGRVLPFVIHTPNNIIKR